MGEIGLDNLMEVWGRSSGISRHDIIRAVQENLVQRDGNLRFGLSVCNQETFVRVMARRDRVRPARARGRMQQQRQVDDGSDDDGNS